MNRIIFIFILLFATWFAKGFSHIENRPIATQSSLNEFEETLKEKDKISGFNLFDSNSPQNDSNSPHSKKRVKCSESNSCCYLHNETLFKPNLKDIKLFFVTEITCFFRLFFSNEKRGPPRVI